MKKPIVTLAIVALVSVSFVSLQFTSEQQLELSRSDFAHAQLAQILQPIAAQTTSTDSQAQYLATRIRTLSSAIAIAKPITKLVQSTTPAPDNTLIQLQQSAERKQLMKELMRTNPQLFNYLALTDTERSILPAVVQANVEKSTTITGTITTIHVDDFVNEKNDYYMYYVDTASGRYSFYPTHETPILSGTTVKISGYAIDDQFSTDVSQHPVALLDSGPALESVGNQRTLVLLIKSFATDPEPFTPEKGHDLVFNSQFQNFMKEQSYGKVSFSGDVYGWIPYGKQITNSCTSLDNDQLSQALKTYNINLQNYDRLVLLWKGVGGGCSGVGKGLFMLNTTKYRLSQSSIGLSAYDQPSGWGREQFVWTNLDYVLSHELGHGLGVVHANAWYCQNSQQLYGNCEHREYGNPFDVMGNGQGYALDYNAYFKQQLGWIPASQVVNIDTSGSYTIQPLELMDNTKLAQVRIPRISQNTGVTPQNTSNMVTAYGLEFRKGIGFDSNLNTQSTADNQKGILINHIQDNSYAPATELINMSAASNYALQSLNVPAKGTIPTLDDPGRGVTIGPVTAVSGSAVSFDVNIHPPTCKRIPPVLFSYFNENVAAGGTGNIRVGITNEDYYSCGSSAFAAAIVSPAGWNSSWNSQNQPVIGSGSDSSDYIGLSVPANTPPGDYNITIEVTNKVSGMKNTVLTHAYVTSALTISGVDPVYGKAGVQIKIKGTGFDPTQNMINFSGGNGWAETVTLPSSNRVIIYTIPTKLTSCPPETGCHTFDTPDGDYMITVSANNSNVSVPFHVGAQVIPSTANVIGTPTLMMQYDPSGGEVSLVSNFSVEVHAGSSPEKIQKITRFMNILQPARLQPARMSLGAGKRRTYNQPVRQLTVTSMSFLQILLRLLSSRWRVIPKQCLLAHTTLS